MSSERLFRRQFLSLVVVASGSSSLAQAKPAVQRVPQALAIGERDPFPNSRLPVLLYRAALSGRALGGGPLPSGSKLAGAFESRFGHNGWKGSWRGGLYKFHHFHSTAHEALGVFQGRVSVRLGGPGGMLVAVRAGDVLVLPAGVGHKNEGQSDDFRVLGAYPTGTTWDMQYGKAGERPAADRRIGQVPLPKKDPLFGSAGPLCRTWS